jgi:hypothetical protein
MGFSKCTGGGVRVRRPAIFLAAPRGVDRGNSGKGKVKTG